LVSDAALGRGSHSLLQTKFPVEFRNFRWRLLNERRWSGELRRAYSPRHKSISAFQIAGKVS
jgi:hypothetical protein